MEAGTAVGPLWGAAVAGREKTSDSEDEGWQIGYLDRASQLQVERAKNPTHIPLMEEASTWKSRILKRKSITICGFGLILFICKLTFQRK
ncbi:Ankyrin repeat, SAM and basic leucine zipper domain-containing protein 1 [Sciurus carolinensis]|uniref:Ankyrin repeat, SAM and basic leucine zipper domain-containing protein 1 n=1 Tax=Sciurus carolinensis TaxID=30640 RepID=A0AA41SPN6_SCICA|nr:Ankyrin repeat, SAM and basic leucine zipper domain-containing protein 1 [Sciurus carolinensis]